VADEILRISCDLSGALAALDAVEQDVLMAVEKGMAVVTLDTMGEAMRNAPILTGNLRGSGSARINNRPVGHTENDNGSTSVVDDGFVPVGNTIEVHGEVGFDVEYAMDQHENLAYRHPRGGKAKFLEDVIKEKSSDYEAVIGECVRGEL
jgi:hypothetical protein